MRHLDENDPIFQLFDLKGEWELFLLCRRAGIQSPFCFRAKRRSLFLAKHLIDEDGKISLPLLKQIHALIKKKGYIIADDGQSDGEITLHFLRVLEALQKEPQYIEKLHQFGLPICDEIAEILIMTTLQIEEPITERHVIWAVLSALLCPLRQSVGSCFATAPAIMIHEEQIGYFLDDMQSLLNKRLMTRVFGGEEFAVPMSPSPGVGDLKREFLGENFSHSPGLIHALCNAKLIEKNLPLHEKVEKSTALIVPYKEKRTILEIIEALLMDHFKISQNDIDSYQAFLIKPGLIPPKMDLVEKFQVCLQKAKWDFVAFADHLLLKSWEFTIASFADVKMEFSSWNLYLSLGLHHEDQGGIGELIFTRLQRDLDETNEELEKKHREYEMAFDHVRLTERLLKNASSESEARRLRAEHISRVYHFQECERKRDELAEKASLISSFFPFLIEKYAHYFKEFFQEIYDSEMQEMSGEGYNDSPAGFRLMYKHGRAHVSSWTFINSKEEYLRSLKDFFLFSENSIEQECEGEGSKKLISELTTYIIYLISSEEFFKTSIIRLASARHISPSQVKPWAYISGGTMTTLLKTYFRREGEISEEQRVVESPTDLAVFLLETLKSLPPYITNIFAKDPDKKMLMTSPTHTFLFLPGYEGFRSGWEDSGFTYTWIRDQIIIPRRNFYKKIHLDSHQQLFLVQELAKKLPLDHRYFLQRDFNPIPKPAKIDTFQKKLLKEFSFLNSILVDAHLYEMLPLNQSKGIMGRSTFHTLLLEEQISFQREDIQLKEMREMEKQGMSPPPPMIFADSNWAKFYFAFIVNPASYELELWGTDKIGKYAFPMSDWKSCLDGSDKRPWRIFLNPFEYC